jgi:hypothetical protein
VPTLWRDNPKKLALSKLNDLWALDFSTEKWRELHPLGQNAPVARCVPILALSVSILALSASIFALSVPLRALRRAPAERRRRSFCLFWFVALSLGRARARWRSF